MFGGFGAGAGFGGGGGFGAPPAAGAAAAAAAAPAASPQSNPWDAPIDEGPDVSRLQDLMLGDDGSFAEHKAAILQSCGLDGAAPASGQLRALALIFQSASPEYHSDAELAERPNHMQFLQEVLRKNAVAKVVMFLSEPFKAMQGSPSTATVSQDCVHAAATLVAATQRFQLTAEELNLLLDALHTSLQVLDGWTDQGVGGAGGSWLQPSEMGGVGSGTIAGAPAKPQLRFPSGTPGALLEDVAYLLALSVVNTLRIPQEDTLGLWSRDQPTRLQTNALLANAQVTEKLSQMCCKSPQAPANTYVLDRIAHIGKGDRRSREEAAGYYAIVLIGVSAFLLASADGNAQRVGVLALQMCCGSMAQLALESRVLARCKWKGNVFARGKVTAVRPDDTLVVLFDEGEEEAVPRSGVQLESSHQLSGHGWARAREWFPTFFSCGLGTSITQELALQCLSTAMDCWLAQAMCVLVDDLIPAEQEEFRVWEECLRQRDAPSAYAAAWSFGGGYQRQAPSAAAAAAAQQPAEVPPTPECRVLVDIMRLVAFALNPEQVSPQGRVPLGWRHELVSAVLGYNAADSSIRSPRAGTAMFIRFIRKAHGSQGPLAWIVESSPGNQDLCPTALSVLSAYLNVCSALCVTDDATQAVFALMQESRSSYHISLKFILIEPDTSVMASYVTGGAAITPHAETFLYSAVDLIATFVTRSPTVKERITQQTDLFASCRTRLFTLLERPINGTVVGKVFVALAAWADTHEESVQMWLSVHQGSVLFPRPPPQGGAGDYGRPPQQMGMGEAPGTVAVAAAPVGGMDYELAQERLTRTYPQTIGFLTLVLRLLTTVNWRTAAQAPVPMHELACVYVRWTLEAVMSRWDDQRYDNLMEKWHMATLVLRIIRAALLISDPGFDQTRQRSPQAVIWNAVATQSLLTKLMALTVERRARDMRTGAVMDELLAECLATIYAVLKESQRARGPDGTTREHVKGIAQHLVDWDNGGLVLKLASDEWHSIALDSANPTLISQLCLLILLHLAHERCRLSHHFITSGRGRPEDITRDAEQTLLDKCKNACLQLKERGAGEEAAALDKHVIRPIEAGVRVSSLTPQLHKYLLRPMHQLGEQFRVEANEVYASLPLFANNRADMVQEVLATILDMDAADGHDTRRELVCEVIQQTLESGAYYYNLAHILCGIPERYVEARTRGTLGMAEQDVLRPFGSQRRTCLSVLVERLLEADYAFVKLNPAAATQFVKTLAVLAADRVVGRAVLRHLRGVNLVEKLMGLLKERLSELTVQNSSVGVVAREFNLCASVLKLAALELFTNPDTSAQNHILKLLCTTREWHHPLLLEAMRSIDLDSLPIPPPISDMLSVPVHVSQEDGVPQYSLEALEEQLSGAGPQAQAQALALARQANASLAVYPAVVDFVEQWCRLADVTLVAIGSETDDDRSSATEVDEVLFQTLLTLLNQMSTNLGRERTMPHMENVVETLLTRQRAKIDVRLARTAIALVDTMHARAAFSGAASSRSAEQLGHLLRPLLQALCDATEKELRTSLYTVLIAFLHSVDANPGFDNRAPETQLEADKMQIRKACQDELLRSPAALHQRLLADVTCADETGVLTTAAWTTMAKLVEWDHLGQQVTAQLHNSSLIGQQLAMYDEVLCEVLRVANQGETKGSQYVGGYQAFASFLLSYANAPGGAKALVEQHSFLRHITKRTFLGLCGDSFPSTAVLLQERCAQVALPMLRVVCAVAHSLPSDHTVMQEVHELFQQHSRLFDFILRRPFSLKKAHDSLDVVSLQMLECATQLLSLYAGSSAPCARNTAPNLVQQYQLRSVLAELGSRSAWLAKLVPEAACTSLVASGGQGIADEATAIVTGVVFNVLQCMRKVSDANAVSGIAQPLFQLSVSDPNGISPETILSRVDVTVLLCCLRDLFTSASHLMKAAPAEADSLLLMVHHSVAEALLLLFHHVRSGEQDDGQYLCQAQQHVAPIIKEAASYVQSFLLISRHDEVTSEIMGTVDTIVKAIAEALGLPMASTDYVR